MRKQIKTTASCALALILAAANCVSVSAEGKTSLTKDDITDAIYILDDEEPPVMDKRQPVVDVSALPSKFDLRDVDGKNYVSPIKKQDPWQTCWSFGATAAAETSIAYELGHDYSAETGSDEDNMFDLSEKHLAWYTYTALPDDCKEYPSQAGEGYHFDLYDEADPKVISQIVYNKGGLMNYATAVYSAGMGPALEAIVPYKETVEKEKSVITLYVYEVTPYGDFSCTKTEYDTSETTVEELRKEWIEKGYTEDTDPYSGRLFYSFAERGINHLDVDEEKAAQAPNAVEKHFIAFVDNSTGDWTLDESQRFLSLYTLSDGNMLPCPALKGKNGEYIFNQTGVDAIKSELVNGRAVSIAFYGDQSAPGQELSANDDNYIGFFDKDGNPTTDKLAEYWTQYTYDKDYDPTDENSVNKRVTFNHAVCIVGYDDDFPKEYFKDPNGTIGGNGAFLVKNSWGAAEYNEDGSLLSSWGNAGSGYFWLSYYDQSLDIPESFDFETENANIPRNVDMYDFLPNGGLTFRSFDDDVYMANVFTAQNNCTVRCIGLEAADADIDVEYSVYMLSDNAKSPIDGELIAEASEHFNYAGYHVVDIGKTWYLPKDSKYSIVVKAGADGKSELFYSEVFNDNDLDPTAPRSGSYDFYAKGIVNPGESFVGTSLDDPDAWTDWSEIVTDLRTRSLELLEHGISYDNFPIRSYPQTEPVTILNMSREPEKETYQAGDTLKGIIYVENNSKVDYDYIDLQLAVSIGDVVKDFPVAELNNLKAGQIKSVTYEYTLSEKDAAAGSLAITAAVMFNGEELDYGALFDESLTYTVNTSGGTSSADAAADKNPATGSDIAPVVMLAGISAAAIAISRKRR